MMTLEEAEKELESSSYIDFCDAPESVCLDGWFSAKELEAVLVIMESRK